MTAAAIANSSSAASGLGAFNPSQERIRQLTVISDFGDIRIDVFRNGTIPILLASRFAHPREICEVGPLKDG
jgi:hypothetical protein